MIGQGFKFQEITEGFAICPFRPLGLFSFHPLLLYPFHPLRLYPFFPYAFLPFFLAPLNFSRTCGRAQNTLRI